MSYVRITRILLLSFYLSIKSIIKAFIIRVTYQVYLIAGIKSDWFSYHLRKAVQFNLFDLCWYRSENSDVNFSEIHPFSHYLSYGWRQERPPSMHFNAELYEKIASNFRVGYENPVIDAIQRVNKGLIPKKVLKKFAKKNTQSNATILSLRDGISISGFLKSEIGLGQAARTLVQAVDSTSISSSLHDFPLKGRASDKEYEGRIKEIRDRRCNLLIIPITELTLRRYELRKGVHSILYPLWELPLIPRSFEKEVGRYDEVWVPSKFIAAMFEPLGIKTILVRQPLPIPDFHDEMQVGHSSLKVLSYFDFDSHVARKNIKAPIIAFQEAFPGQDDVTLTIKVRGSSDNGFRSWLAAQAVIDKRIRIIDATLSRADIDRLIMECDVFISLHRSEGFGFGAAEALAAGKAVVSTDYSGTTDFITPETGYPVEYDLIAVKEGEYPYWENQVWAEPRMESAVAALREIYTDREAAREKGRRGRKFMRCRHSPAVIGAQIKQLLIERGLISQDNEHE